MIHHPDLIRIPLGHRNRLEANTDCAGKAQRIAVDLIDFKAIRGRVGHVHPLTVGGQRQWPHRAALEYDQTVRGGISGQGVGRRSALHHWALEQRTQRRVDGRRSGRQRRRSGRSRRNVTA